MYINRITVNGRLTEDPVYKIRRGINDSEEYCILKCHTEKPIKVRNVRQKEDIYFEVIAFGNNAASVKNRIFQGTPLLFELEIRNIDSGDGKRSMILQAVKIHFMDRNTRRLDNYSRDETKEEVTQEVDGNVKVEGDMKIPEDDTLESIQIPDKEEVPEEEVKAE